MGAWRRHRDMTQQQQQHDTGREQPEANDIADDRTASGRPTRPRRRYYSTPLPMLASSPSPPDAMPPREACAKREAKSGAYNERYSYGIEDLVRLRVGPTRDALAGTSALHRQFRPPRRQSHADAYTYPSAPADEQAPALTRPLLVCAPSEESDSGWSSASRRSSSSEVSSSSSFDSETPLVPCVYTPYAARRLWYERAKVDNDDDDCADAGEEEERYARYADGESVVMRRMFHSVMHGVVLGLQSLAALAVLSVFVWMTVWKSPDAEPAFWAWLWQVPSMATSSVLVLCVVTMITHEVRVLSALALLYLQAAILLMTSVSALVMWVSVAGRSGEVVQSIMVGCCAFLWGMACLGFLRAVVIWRVMEDEERGMTAALLDDVETYGTLG